MSVPIALAVREKWLIGGLASGDWGSWIIDLECRSGGIERNHLVKGSKLCTKIETENEHLGQKLYGMLIVEKLTYMG